MCVFAAVLIYNVQRIHYPFEYDSLIYWQLADSFRADGDFSILNFAVQLRGYLFPLLLYIIKWQADIIGVDARLGFAFYSALFFTIFTMVIVPWSFREILRWNPGVLRKLILAVLVFYFWRGHFIYPLTDFPAFAAFLIGVALLARTLVNRAGLYWAIPIGFFIGVTINFRPAYLVSIPLIVLLATLAWYKKNMKDLAGWFFLFLAGCGLVLLPQHIINRTHFASSSPLVLAKFDGETNLYVDQLFMGLKYQKVFANVGDNYPPGLVSFRDPFYDKLPRDLKLLTRERRLQDYLGIARHYPLDLMVSYLRHLFNGIDIFHPTPYVYDVFASHAFFSLVNYLIWFLFLYHVFRSDFTGMGHIKLVCVFILLSPVVLAIPTEVEVRFFLPLFILAYGVVSYRIDYQQLIVSAFRDRYYFLRMLFLGILWVLNCYSMSFGTIEKLVKINP